MPVVTLSVLACLPFLVAWRRQVVTWKVALAYTVPSATVMGCAIAQPDVGTWFAAVVWAFIITAVVHVLLLDRRPRPGKAAGWETPFGK
ncbi:hypothetical protein AB0M29_02420 [Streptomyces sp. NPDC051976]|uniref:hypothetical protein n=1 Tax=Streptomyces sp. NPDC051976 TaxID=3154947 RepID=UPI00344102C6